MSGKLKPGTFDVVPRALATDRRMSAIAVRVVLYIRSYGDRAFPSYATIARDLRITRRTAISAVKLGVACGYIKKNGRLDPSGDPTSNGYRINFEQGGGETGFTTQWRPRHHPGETSDTRVVKPVSPYRELLNESHLTRSAAAPAAPPGASGGRAALPPDLKSESSRPIAAREAELTGPARPAHDSRREGHEHEARQDHEPRDPAVVIAEYELFAKVETWRQTGKWDRADGPPPFAKGCRVPPQMLPKAADCKRHKGA